MTRQEMMNYLASRQGLEAKETIWFFKLCEEYPNATGETLYNVFINLLYIIDSIDMLEEGDAE